MFSIIVPTLQNGNPEILKHLLDVLNSDSAVGEIILIDNSRKGYDTKNLNKVRLITPKKNLYVNPSWNLGISMAQYDYFGILNDDLIIPINLCEKIMEKFEKEYLGLTGLSNAIKNVGTAALNFCEKNTPIESLDFDILEQRTDVTYWGSAIFGKKQDYYEIPTNIKIWCGDDYLFYMNKKNQKYCYQILTDKIFHIHSTTTSLRNWYKIKKNDIQNFARIDKNFEIPIGYKNNKLKALWLFCRRLGLICQIKNIS